MEKSLAPYENFTDFRDNFADKLIAVFAGKSKFSPEDKQDMRNRVLDMFDYIIYKEVDKKTAGLNLILRDLKAILSLIAGMTDPCFQCEDEFRGDENFLHGQGLSSTEAASCLEDQKRTELFIKALRMALSEQAKKKVALNH